jgi:PAS domain S-box-containing protein
MKDKDKTKEELLEALAESRRRVDELESAEASRELVGENFRESEERFRTFADFTYDWEEWVKPDGTYYYVSPSCERITGYRPDEFIDDPGLIEEIAHPDDLGKIYKHLHDDFGQQAASHIDFRIISRSGEERWISHYCQAVYNIDGEWLGRRGSNRDITERRQTAAELRRANRALRVLSECNQAMIRATDEIAFLNDVCLLIVDEGAYRLAWVGYAEQDEKKTVSPIAQAGFDDGYLETADITWGETERGWGPTGTAIRVGSPTVCKNILTDPKFKPWRHEASKRGYASIIALPLTTETDTFGALNIYATEPDAFSPEEVKLLMELADDLAYGITSIRTRAERKRIVEALRESEARYKGIVEHTVNGVAVYRTDNDGEDFIFMDFNKSAERIEKIKKEDLIGRRVTEVFPGVKEFGIFEVFKRVWASGRPEHYPVSLYKDQRIVGWRENFVYKLPSGEIVAVYSDETERKQAEEALRKAHDELYHLSQELEKKVQNRTKELEEKSRKLVEAERLAALGKMANRIAHELRNPLTVVGGFARRMNDKTPQNDPNKRYLKIITEEVMALEKRVSEIIKVEYEE